MSKMNLEYYKGSDQYSDGDVEERILKDVRRFRSGYGSADRDVKEGQADAAKTFGKAEASEGFETALADSLVGESCARENEADAFAYLYHLSPVRQNILSWYPFRKDADALEIGAGPGAITGLLCRKLSSVTSVDLSKRRCEINFERHRELDNLNIMVGNLNDMKFPGLFDYVVLNGVFEYAASFTEGETPYRTFLRKCMGFLKEDGVLLVAIENRLGLKYFSGAPEDHTGNYMEGLMGYRKGSGVRTFSRGEWRELAEDCGAEISRIYYPYPDYKFPSEVFTDESLRADSFDRNNWNFSGRRLRLFEESGVAKALQKEGILGSFMNSFLLEIRKKSGQDGTCAARRADKASEDRVIYAKMNADRGRRFRIQTLVLEKSDGSREVVKQPLTPEAAGHLRRMRLHEPEEPVGRIPLGGQNRAVFMLAGRERGRSLVYPYLSGENLGTLIASAAGRKDAGTVKKLTDALWDLLLCRQIPDEGNSGSAPRGIAESPDFREVFGQDTVEDPGPMVCPANIDLIFDNIFLDGTDRQVPGASSGTASGASSGTAGGAFIIDGEWIFDFPVPARFILWRTINELYSCHRELETTLPEQELLSEYGIGPRDAQTFWTWADHFEKRYVEANGLARYARPVREADLRDIHTFAGKVRMTATLYLDRGQGFSEKDAVVRQVSIGKGGQFEAEFVLPEPENVRSVRFDPLEGSPCVCALSSEEGDLRPLNASFARKKKETGRVCEFLTADPSYILKIRGKMPSIVRVTGKVKLQSREWALDRAAGLLSRYQRIFRLW